jgi:hypothetical protein
MGWREVWSRCSGKGKAVDEKEGENDNNAGQDTPP